jgi:hypothetical protein
MRTRPPGFIGTKFHLEMVVLEDILLVALATQNSRLILSDCENYVRYLFE